MKVLNFHYMQVKISQYINQAQQFQIKINFLQMGDLVNLKGKE